MPRKVTIAAASIIVLHLLEITTLGTSRLGFLAAECLESLAALMAAGMCFGAYRRASGMSRPLWILVGLGIASLCLDNVAWTYHLLTSQSWMDPVSQVLANLRPMFLTTALFLDPEKDSSKIDGETVIDFVQVMIVFSLVYVYLSYIPISVQGVGIGRYAIVMVVERGAMIVLAVVQMARARQAHLHELYRAMLIYLGWFLCVEGSAVYVQVSRGIHAGTLIDLAYTLPTLGVALYAASWKSHAEVQRRTEVRPKGFRDMLLTNATITAAPLIVLLQVAQLGSQLPLLRYSLLAGSVLCFATRLGLSEYRQSLQLNSLLQHQLMIEFSQQELRVQKAYLEQLIESAPEAIVIVDVNNAIRRINREFTRLFGYTSEEARGQDLRTLIVPGDKMEESLQIDEAARQGKSSMLDTIRRNKDGLQIDVSVLCAFVELTCDSNAYFGIYRDIREEKKTEEHLRQAQKMEAMGRLAGGVAHDFNNLLLVIMGHSELIRSEIPPESPSMRRVDAIQGASRRAASLTAQLLAFSRRQALQPKVLNLNAIVTDTDKLLGRLLGEDIESNIVLEGQLGQVKADPGQMVQVLLNLSVNARDAMPNGGRLSIATANAKLEESTLFQGVPVRPGRYVRLTVHDTGTGMDAETQARIFEPFFTTKAEGKGTGLGLATVFGIVEQSAGYIFVETELGKGTAFQIYLPQVDEAAEAKPARKAAVPGRAGSETILLVEDDELLRELICEALQASGYKLLVACDGVDALEVSGRYRDRIHLMIADVILPKMNGPDLARAVNASRPETKVLFTSGYTADKLGNIPASDPKLLLIQKPFRLEDLALKVREVLDMASVPQSAPQARSGGGAAAAAKAG